MSCINSDLTNFNAIEFRASNSFIQAGTFNSTVFTHFVVMSSKTPIP
jgi:hypothetical protein